MRPTDGLGGISRTTCVCVHPCSTASPPSAQGRRIVSVGAHAGERVEIDMI